MASELQSDWRRKDSALDLLERALDSSTAEQTEVALEAQRRSLTRFARSQIHQNVSESDCKLSIRCIENGHVGHASTNRFDKDSLRVALEWAREVARSERIPAEPARLPGPQSYTPIHNYSEATAALPSRQRAEMVSRLIEKCAAKGADAAGAVSNTESALAIANSSGLRAYHAQTDCNFTTTVSADGSTGWCDCYSVDASRLDADAMGERALGRALAGRNPRKIEPGRHTVILEEAAVKDFLDFLAWLGFGAQAFEEGRSFMCGKLDKKITGDIITITDDAYDTRGTGVPFDFEGIPRQKVVLIKKGIARSVVYDRTYAARAGTSSTGHALPPRFTYGPLPLNVVMTPGHSNIDEMVGSVKRGLLVSRFWYCRPVDPAKTLITGQTRDGTFLIEDGEIVCGVNDMRFNENILETLSRATMISDRLRRVGSTLAPAVKLADFRFTEPVREQ